MTGLYYSFEEQTYTIIRVADAKYPLLEKDAKLLYSSEQWEQVEAFRDAIFNKPLMRYYTLATSLRARRSFNTKGLL